MRTLFIIPLVLMSLVSFPSWGLTMDDLVGRNYIYYKKFTDVPFTGEVDKGRSQGQLKNGKKVGEWVYYFDTGQLSHKGSYNNGNRRGFWEFFFTNGDLDSKGNYNKNGRREGLWVSYWDNIPFEVAEMIIAHKTGSKVARAYNRTDYLDQRRPYLERWADFLVLKTGPR